MVYEISRIFLMGSIQEGILNLKKCENCFDQINKKQKKKYGKIVKIQDLCVVLKLVTYYGICYFAKVVQLLFCFLQFLV